MISWADLAIVLLLLISGLLGYRSGVIQAFGSLVGLLAGIAVASRNYGRASDELSGVIHDRPIANAIGFLLVALLVMLVAGLIAFVLKKMIHGVGLGWLDNLAGLLFGLLRGALLVTLCIVTLVAFFPESLWLGDSQLARYFRGGVDLTILASPVDLKEKVTHGLQVVENDTRKILDKSAKELARPKESGNK